MYATVCVLTDCPIDPVDDGHGLSVKAPTPCTDNASLHHPSFGKFHSVTSPAADIKTPPPHLHVSGQGNREASTMLIRRVFFAQFFYASLGASICRAATVPDFPTPVSVIQFLPLEQHMDATVCVLTDCPIAQVDDGHGLLPVKAFRFGRIAAAIDGIQYRVSVMTRLAPNP
ncbi:hypothetical protein MRX96_040668 [Rhipicephalus microplus]